MTGLAMVLLKYDQQKIRRVVVFPYWSFYNECFYILVNEYHDDSMMKSWVTLVSILLISLIKGNSTDY